MRKQAKLLANFLGATKELTSEYADLAAITADELDQISFTVMKREDRKTTAKLLHERQIVRARPSGDMLVLEFSQKLSDGAL